MATLKGNYPTKTKTFDGKVYETNLKAMTKSDLEMYDENGSFQLN